MLSDYNSFVCASPDNQDNTAHFSKIYIHTPYAIQKRHFENDDDVCTGTWEMDMFSRTGRLRL